MIHSRRQIAITLAIVLGIYICLASLEPGPAFRSVPLTDSVATTVDNVASQAGGVSHPARAGSLTPPAQASNVEITVTTDPPGSGSITVDATSFTPPQTFTWLPGSTHTIGASSPVGGGVGTRYVFRSWSDGGSQTHTITVPSVGATYTASYGTQYLLTMQTNSSDGGGVSPPSGFYDSGQVVPISATPNTGYAFMGWQGTGAGNYTGSNNPATAMMNGPVTEIALFAVPIPEFPGAFLFLAVLVGILSAMMVERRLRPRP